MKITILSIEIRIIKENYFFCQEYVRSLEDFPNPQLEHSLCRLCIVILPHRRHAM